MKEEIIMVIETMDKIIETDETAEIRISETVDWETLLPTKRMTGIWIIARIGEWMIQEDNNNNNLVLIGEITMLLWKNYLMQC